MRRPCLSSNLLILFADFISNSFAQFDFGKETAGFFQFGKLPEEVAIGNVSTEASEAAAIPSVAERRSQPFTVFADLTQTSTKDPVVSLGNHFAADKVSNLLVNGTDESGGIEEGRIEERDLGHGHGGGFSHGGGGHGGGYGGGHSHSSGYSGGHGGHGGYGGDDHGGGGYGDDHGGHGGYGDDHGGHGGYGDDHKGGLVNYGIHSGKKVTA